RIEAGRVNRAAPIGNASGATKTSAPLRLTLLVSAFGGSELSILFTASSIKIGNLPLRGRSHSREEQGSRADWRRLHSGKVGRRSRSDHEHGSVIKGNE